MYELIPRKSNNKARGVIIILFLATAALFLASELIPNLPFVWIPQLLGILFAVPAVYLVSRYVAKSFLYRVESTDRGVDLTVSEASFGGKRRTVVCRIGLSSIKKRILLEGDGCSLSPFKKEKKPTYDYRPDLCPSKSILILSDEGGVEVYICLASEEKLFELLAPVEDVEDEEN